MTAARLGGKRVGYLRVSTVNQKTDRQLEGIALNKRFTDKLLVKTPSGPKTRRFSISATEMSLWCIPWIAVHLLRDKPDYRGSYTSEIWNRSLTASLALCQDLVCRSAVRTHPSPNPAVPPRMSRQAERQEEPARVFEVTSSLWGGVFNFTSLSSERFRWGSPKQIKTR
jgi:hypothetical protein